MSGGFKDDGQRSGNPAFEHISIVGEITEAFTKHSQIAGIAISGIVDGAPHPATGRPERLSIYSFMTGDSASHRVLARSHGALNLKHEYNLAVSQDELDNLTNEEAHIDALLRSRLARTAFTAALSLHALKEVQAHPTRLGSGLTSLSSLFKDLKN